MPNREIKTKYFEFHQNNSGGSFHTDDAEGIGPRVWIEATDAGDACRRATSVGIYFDGVRNGADCPCCGDRWYEPWGKGDAQPEINQEYDFNWHDTVYVHHVDGKIERIKSAAMTATEPARSGEPS